MMVVLGQWLQMWRTTKGEIVHGGRWQGKTDLSLLADENTKVWICEFACMPASVNLCACNDGGCL